MRPFVASLVIAATPCLAADPAAAQRAAAPATRSSPAAAMPDRAVLLEDVERSRRNVLKYLDAAPDSVLRYRPMPGVRTFAEQIEHAAGATVFIMRAAWRQPPAATPPADTAARRRDRAVLRAYVNESYSAFAQMVQDATPAQLSTPATFAGTTVAGWRWVGTALEHATWTLGQTVPYLRATGVTPPQYLPF